MAYETVLKRERAAYHGRVAEWLEQISGARRSEYLPQIAEHYQKAANAAQATLCYEQAGDQAMRVSAFGNAARFYSHVQSHNTSSYLKLAEAHFRLGDYPAARSAMQQAQGAAQTEAEQASALGLLGDLTSEMGDYGEAQTLLTRAVSLARKSQDQRALCFALLAFGGNEWSLGRLDEACAALEESLELARALGDITRELFALNRLGIVMGIKGHLDEADQFFREVQTLAAAVGNRERAMVALGNLGRVADDRKDYTLARDCQQQALAIAREIGAQYSIVAALNNLASLETGCKNLPAARERLREGLELSLRLGMLPQVICAVNIFAELTHAEGQTERALALWGLARRQPGWSNDHQYGMDIMLVNWDLDSSVTEAGMRKGEELDWNETIQEIICL